MLHNSHHTTTIQVRVPVYQYRYFRTRMPLQEFFGLVRTCEHVHLLEVEVDLAHVEDHADGAGFCLEDVADQGHFVAGEAVLGEIGIGFGAEQVTHIGIKRI